MIPVPGLALFGLFMLFGSQLGVAQPGNYLSVPVPPGDAKRGRLVFATCRACHYTESVRGHNNGPNLHRIFGKVVGKQPGFAYYSEQFRDADFVWTPGLMYSWLENPRRMFPASSMMSLGVPDTQRRADLIAYLKLASIRGLDNDSGSGSTP